MKTSLHCLLRDNSLPIRTPGCVTVRTPPANDVYLIQRLIGHEDLWVWAPEETSAVIQLSIKWLNRSVSKESLQFEIQEKEAWKPLRISVAEKGAKRVELRDVFSGRRVGQGSKVIGEGNVFFYFESKREVYWSLGCSASGKMNPDAVLVRSSCAFVG